MDAKKLAVLLYVFNIAFSASFLEFSAALRINLNVSSLLLWVNPAFVSFTVCLSFLVNTGIQFFRVELEPVRRVSADTKLGVFRVAQPTGQEVGLSSTQCKLVCSA